MQDNRKLTLGSLFDGSGGFPLAGLLAGVTPVWASEIEPFPIRVTTKRMPWIKHYGDISQMNGGEIEPVDIITFGSPCFPAGTLVLTDKGLVEIENIRVGDMVLTHKGRWRKITAVGAKESRTIRLKGNHCGLECTPNHPIYSFDEKEFSWIPAENMRGKMWCVPTSMEYISPPKPVYYKDKHVKPLPEFSEGFFYFIGRWLGDGWVRDGQRSGRPLGQTFSTIYLCDSEDKFDELISTVRCISDRYSIEHGDACVKVKCNGRALCDFLTENFGKYAHGKEIPSWVLSLPCEYRCALLEGILDSDGCRTPHSYRITTTSKKLAFGIRLLAESLGKETTVYYDERPSEYTIQGRLVNQRCSYTTEIQDRNTHRNDGLHRWYKVKSITAASEKTIVYNMTVEEDNSYTADGIVVHNCQDMSVAGKRDGLDGSRSSLFYEAVRIVKEMRCKTNGRYPRYLVWENVPGAFSSNGGEDFRCVLESLCRVKDEELYVPRPAKWPYAGEILGDGFSIAWRQLNACGWGVAQRRKRIYLVADLDGWSAGKILFESEGRSRYTPQGFRAWEETPGGSAESIGETSCFSVDGYNSAVDTVAATLGVNCGMSTGRNGALVLNDQGGCRMDITEEQTCTLRAESHHPPCILEDAYALENHPTDSRIKLSEDGQVQTLTSRMGTGGNNVPLLMKIRCGGGNGGKGALIQEDCSATLSCGNDQTLFEPKAFGICSKDSNAMKSPNPHSGFYEAETSRTLDLNGGNPSCNQGGVAVVALEGNGSRPSHHGDGYKESETMFTLNTIEQHGVAYSMTTGSFMQWNEETAPTLAARDYKDPPVVNANTERHGVTYGIGRDAFNQGRNALFNPAIAEEVQPTIIAKGPGAVAEPAKTEGNPTYGFYPQMKAECVTFTEEKATCLVNGTNPGFQNGVLEQEYIVRRLTPTECARLQGFPDWWCSDLGTEHPTDAEVYEWYKIFETHRRVVGGSSKPKTEKQIRAFLKNPHSDSAEYKMWGNGIALPNAYFVLCGIAWADGLSV